MHQVKRGIAILCLLGLFLGLAGCTPQETKIDPRGVVFFNYFDTVSYVYSYAGDSVERFESRSTEVSSILEEYHKLFDIYHEYSGMNNLCTVNRLAGGEAVKVDKKLIDFLLYAKEIYTLTQGETNIMLGAVLRLWHDARTAGTSLPDPTALEEASKHTDISLLEIDKENSTVRLTDPKASVDVGALGKGYATEMAAKHLSAQGCNGYVLNIGGNIRTIGDKPDGSGWRTGFKDPKDPQNSYSAYTTIRGTACVTSGNYERYYTVNNVRYHHIIDKDTLYPANYVDAVSILTPDSGLADALSTALFCMSYEDGLKLVSTMPQVQVIWIFSTGEVKTTPNLTVDFEA
ncbi:MAG: FAD:protein FMN transferase [Oscillospiraceae bacterium]|nr:FAD:protein FMN transferase [Oscillospiraceae bacterium]